MHVEWIEEILEEYTVELSEPFVSRDGIWYSRDIIVLNFFIIICVF